MAYPKILNILKALHKDTSGAVRAYGKSPKSFGLEMVSRQDDVLAPMLFNLLFDAVINMPLQKHPGNGITILFNSKAELVRYSKQTRDQTLIPDLYIQLSLCPVLL